MTKRFSIREGYFDEIYTVVTSLLYFRVQIIFFRNEYRWWKSFIAACRRNDVLSFWEYHIFEKLFGESNTGVRWSSQQVKFINLDKSTIIFKSKKLNLNKMSERRSAVSGWAGGHIIRKLSSQWAGREIAKNPDVSSRAT